jgi:cytochrome c biogenesis protein CcdA
MGVSLITITAAALADSFNPCGIAALIILLFTLVETKKSHKILTTGFAFIAGVFLVYFLFGLGAFQFLKLSFLAPYLHWTVGLLAIVIGVKSIYDYWQRRDECRVCEDDYTFKVPTWGRGFFAKVIRKMITLPGAFILGGLVILIEIPCTGGPYFFALGYITEQGSRLSLIPILLYYNFVTFLPLMILIVLTYFGFLSIEQTKKWKEKYLLRLQLIAGIVMIGLGLLVILT